MFAWRFASQQWQWIPDDLSIVDLFDTKKLTGGWIVGAQSRKTFDDSKKKKTISLDAATDCTIL